MDAKNSTVIPAVTSGENNIFSRTTNTIPEAGLEEKWYHPKCHYTESQLLEAELNFTGLYSSVTAAPARVQGKPTQIHSQIHSLARALRGKSPLLCLTLPFLLWGLCPALELCIWLHPRAAGILLPSGTSPVSNSQES